MARPPLKQVKPAAALPSIAPEFEIAAAVLEPPPSSMAGVLPTAPSPPAPPPAEPAQCTCDSATYTELRSSNASFTNTSSDALLLNMTAGASWTTLYIAPGLVLPNNTQDYVFFQARIGFSHPVQYINSAKIRLYTNALTSVLQSAAPRLEDVNTPTCTGGFVQPAPPFSPEPDATITAVYEAADCKALYIRGYAPLLDPLATNSTQLVVDVSAASVIDACGERFPGTSFTADIRSRQVAELYALALAYTPRLGPATSSATTRIAAVFTQPVPGIKASFFRVTGPKSAHVARVRLMAGTQSYYTFSVTVADGYFGTVNVTMTAAAALQVLRSNSTLPFVSYEKLAVQC